jgi:hypothetical protein
MEAKTFSNDANISELFRELTCEKSKLLPVFGLRKQNLALFEEVSWLEG